MTPLSLGEQRALAAAICELDPEMVTGFVVIAIKPDGQSGVASSAVTAPVVIEALAHVIETLASHLADGIDLQAEAVKGARGE
jgi:hypothetical protein